MSFSAIDCPLTSLSADLNMFLSLYTNKKWQNNSNCYFMKMNSFRGQKYQQVCCFYIICFYIYEINDLKIDKINKKNFQSSAVMINKMVI